MRNSQNKGNRCSHKLSKVYLAPNFCFLWASTSSRSMKTQKNNRPISRHLNRKSLNIVSLNALINHSTYVLTINIDFHCAIWCSSYSIICCTAICSTVKSVGFKDKLIPGSQYTAVIAISIYSGPGDVWCWFTICNTL